MHIFLNNSMNIKTKFTDNHIHILFLIFLVIFTGINLYHQKYLIDYLSPDEGLYSTLGRDISEDFKIGPPKILLDYSEGDLKSMETFSNKHWYYGRPPVIPYMLGILFYFFGVNDFVADAPFIIISVLSVVMIYVLAAMLYNPRIGLLSAFFFGLSPLYLVASTKYIRLMDMPVTLCIMLTILTTHLALKRNSQTTSYMLFVISGVLISLSFLIKYPAGILYVILPGYILLFKGIEMKQKRTFIIILIFSSLVALIPWILYNVGLYDSPLGTFSYYLEYMYREDYQSQNIEPISHQSILGYYGIIIVMFGFPTVFLALLGLYASIKQRSNPDMILLVYTGISLLAYHLYYMYFLSRYMLPILPFTCILGAIGSNYILNTIRSNKNAKDNRTIYDKLIPCIVLVGITLIYVLSAAVVIDYVIMGGKNYESLKIYRMMDLEIREMAPKDAVVASIMYKQTNFYSDRITTPIIMPITNESIRKFNISFFALTDRDSDLPKLNYLQNNSRFRLVRELNYMNNTGYIFEVV